MATKNYQNLFWVQGKNLLNVHKSFSPDSPKLEFQSKLQISFILQTTEKQMATESSPDYRVWGQKQNDGTEK